MAWSFEEGAERFYMHVQSLRLQAPLLCLPHNGVIPDSFRRLGSGTGTFPALSASTTFIGPGNNGAAGVPTPGEPPVLTFTSAPLMVTPPASTLTKLPPALAVSSMAPSTTTLWPA